MFVPQNRSWLRALLLAVLTTMLAVVWAGPSQAAEGSRIQDVTTTQEGKVSFLLSAVSPAPGESLDAGSVTVRIDGKPVQSSTQAADDAAATRTSYLVMDTSGSMGGSPLDAAKAAGQAYLSTVPADVAVGLITFADTATVAVPATTDRAAVSAALQGAQAAGSTALFDAASLAVQQLGDTGSRSIVLLSDGEDEGSTATEEAALTDVTESGVALDAVALTEGVGAEQLGRLATAGGGVVVRAADAQTLSDAFTSVARSSVGELSVTADLPSGLAAGTYPLSASVVVSGATLTDEAIVVVDSDAAIAAAAGAASNVGPIPVQDESIGLLQQVWFLPLLLLVLFVALALIAVQALRGVADDRLQPRRVRKLIGSYDADKRNPAAAGKKENALAARAVAFADEAVKSRDSKRTLEQKLLAGAIPLQPGEWVLLHAAVAFVGAFIAAAATGFSLLWVLVGLFLGASIPYLVLNHRGASRRKEFAEALPDVLQLLAGSVASGYSFLQAVDSVASQSEGVMAAEFGRAVSEARLGVPIEDSLEEVAHRMDSEDFGWVVMAFRINRRVGGNLADVLRTVATTLRERAALHRHVRALTVEGRLSGWIIAAIPVGLLAYLALVNPDYLSPLLTTPIGQMMLITAMVMEVLGIVWIKSMVKVEV